MQAFHFLTKLDQTLLLGLRARNIAELLAGIRAVPDASIYYHTHRFLQQHHFLSPEPPNDFAFWVTHLLGDNDLGEKLWSVNTAGCNDLGELRSKLIGSLESGLSTTRRESECQAGDAFHFMACRTFVLPTSHVAHDPLQFTDQLAEVSIGSLLFHMFDAKLRLRSGENDFSRWFRDQGMAPLADAIKQLDPYSYTLDGLRQSIIALVKRYDSD